jgi:thiol-disulfide isomerase/thioredoxin
MFSYTAKIFASLLLLIISYTSAFAQIYTILELGIRPVKSIYSAFSPGIKQRVYDRQKTTSLKIDDTVRIHGRMFDFEAWDALGKKRKLSDFSGKYILLDFSSVHCVPCVESNDELRAIAKKYHNKLTIVTFNYDKHAEWLQSIKDGNVKWISLNNGQGPRGNISRKYELHAFPTFFIIKPGGIIAEKWAGYEKLQANIGDIERHLLKYLKTP